MTFEGPYLAGCILLVVAGAAKALRPGDTALALARLSGDSRGGALRWAEPLVRGGAVLEAVVGLGGLVFPGRVACLCVAVSYGAFTGYVGYARARGGPLSTCGCFGRPDTPPTVTHMVVTGGIAASAAWSAFTADSLASGLWSSIGPQPWHGLPLLAAAAAIAFVSYLLMTTLATLGVLP